MPTPIEKDIFRTVAYFAYFTYPLSLFEIWKWQLQPSQKWTFAQIVETVQTSTWLHNFLTRRNGFFGIYWKTVPIEEQIATRHRRNINAIEKHKKMRLVLSYVSRLPWVRGIAICNSLAFHHTDSKSDIDLFILTDENRVWSTRLFAVLPMAILRLRPGETKQNPVDMSFFASVNALDMENYKIAENDPYLSFWTRSLIPVYGDSKTWEMWKNENRWSNKDLPVAQWRIGSNRLRTKSNNKLRIPFLESFAELIQRKRLPLELRERANTDSCVIITNNVLKFHKNDRRKEIRDALNEAMKLCEN